jgi:hypothetical protein
MDKVIVAFIEVGNISERVRRIIWSRTSVCSNNVYTFYCIELQIHTTAFFSQLSYPVFGVQIITRPGFLVSLIPSVHCAQTRYFLGTINNANTAQHSSLLPYILLEGSECKGL